MASYCGKSGRVIRFDDFDKADNTLRVQHNDGTIITWPTAVLTFEDVQQSSNPRFPEGVNVGAQVVISSNLKQAAALSRSNPSIGWEEGSQIYCGTVAVIKRYDSIDEKENTLRLLHPNGRTLTWPLEVVLSRLAADFEASMYGADAKWIAAPKPQTEEKDVISDGDEVLVTTEFNKLNIESSEIVPQSFHQILRYAGRRAIVRGSSEGSKIVTVQHTDGIIVEYDQSCLISLHLKMTDVHPKQKVAVVGSWKVATVRTANRSTSMISISESDDDLSDKVSWVPLSSLRRHIKQKPDIGHIAAVSPDDCTAGYLETRLSHFFEEAQLAHCGESGVIIPVKDAFSLVTEVVQMVHSNNKSYVWPISLVVDPSEVPLSLNILGTTTKSPPPEEDRVEKNLTSIPLAPRTPAPAMGAGDSVRLRKYARLEGILDVGEVGVIIDIDTYRSDSYLVKGPHGGTFWYKDIELELVSDAAKQQAEEQVRNSSPTPIPLIPTPMPPPSIPGAARGMAGGRSRGGSRGRGAPVSTSPPPPPPTPIPTQESPPPTSLVSTNRRLPIGQKVHIINEWKIGSKVLLPARSLGVVVEEFPGGVYKVRFEIPGSQPFVCLL
eukprot:TRINITY_DN11757_c0_g1_i1.p1 TRINITY_DN11757_c0_g1~~TRINITY_DN11757_c0_g1_i1.p1  ORF type:complete len:700 (+),score=157.75 TRINITY_DN11757_c0_g1_i1:281-2101(+)